MKALRVLLGLIFFVFLTFSDKAFSSIEELVAFKKDHMAIILANDFVRVSVLGEVIKTNKKRPLKSSIADLLASIERADLPEAWVRWFRRVYEGKSLIDIKEFAVAIFYPYEVLEATHKQHISQMNYAFKASIMYSAEFDPHGPGKITRNILKRDIGVDISSDEQLLHYLDLGFIANSSSFLEKFKAYGHSYHDSFERLIPQVFSSGTAIQTLNLGFMLNHFEREDEALEAFRLAGDKGSVRARIEMGNILLKRNFTEGVRFFNSLGAYGLWKIAQCYRYERNTTQDFGAANHYYLQAVTASQSEDLKYPELFFDAADFAVFYAYSQPDPEIFKVVIASAIDRFVEAGNFHLGPAYLKAAEVSLDGVALFPELVTNLNFTDEFRRNAIKIAFREGHVAKAISFAEKNKLPLAGKTAAEGAQIAILMGYAEQIDRYFGV